MKKILLAISIICISVALTTCFSPWDGDSGNLSIYWGSAKGGRAWTPTPLGEDWKSFNYTVTLKGPGTTVEETFANGVPGATFKLPPGTWSVTIKGTKIFEIGHLTEYFIMGIEQIEVKPGKKSTAQVTMYNAYEITDWSELNESAYPPPLWSSLPSNRPIMFLIANDLKADTSSVAGGELLIGRHCFFVAEKDVVIGRANADNQREFFRITGNSVVTLGKPGMSGTITFDSEGMELDGGISCLIDFAASTNNTLEMNDGVTIKGGKFTSSFGAAVNITGGCIGVVEAFIMNGGVITDNHVIFSGPGPASGGGVIVGNTSIFEWNGGYIYGNTPHNVYP